MKICMNVYGNRFSHHAGNGKACVEVYVQPTTTCKGTIPISIPIPLPSGQQISIQIAIDPPIPFLKLEGCATVRVNAPQCPK
jgi:hypothetical protein